MPINAKTIAIEIAKTRAFIEDALRPEVEGQHESKNYTATMLRECLEYLEFFVALNRPQAEE